MAQITINLKIELPELREIRRKALLAPENWSSLVGKKFDAAETELISDVAVDNNVDHKELKQEKEAILPVKKRFKPKYGPAEVESRCIQYASVLITHVIHTNHLYVQIEDQDLPLPSNDEGSSAKVSWSYKPVTLFLLISSSGHVIKFNKTIFIKNSSLNYLS